MKRYEEIKMPVSLSWLCLRDFLIRFINNIYYSIVLKLNDFGSFTPLIINTNSPLGERSLKTFLISCTVPLMNSSNFFVISLAITNCLSGDFSFNISSVDCILWGLSKKTEVSSLNKAWSNSFDLAPFFVDKKPPKKNLLAGRPAPAIADVTAEGPGIICISWLALATLWTSLAPGSEMSGVPASEI